MRPLQSGNRSLESGIKVGQVTGIDIMYDPKTDSILTPVHFEIEPERIKNIQIAASRGPLENTRLLVQHGLRAQIQSANLITGQMQVDGRVKAKGVFTPDEAIPFDAYVGELARRGIKIEEL